MSVDQGFDYDDLQLLDQHHNLTKAQQLSYGLAGKPNARPS